MTIYDILQQAIYKYPDNLAVADGEVRLTYREVGERVDALALFLRSKGIEQGDRISILDVNSHYFYEAYFAAAGLGAILNPINIRLSETELTYIINDTESRWLLCAPQFCHNAERVIRKRISLKGVLWLGKIPPVKCDISFFSFKDVQSHNERFQPAAVKPDDIAHLYYTSGTTGTPKGVILTHKNVCRHSEGTVQELGLSPHDVWGHIAPMFHLADAWSVFAVTMVGGRHIIQPRFDAEATLELIRSENITISNLIPTMLNLMVKCSHVSECDLSSLRVILSGGAPIAPEVVKKVVEIFGCDYIQTYGMTETSPYLTLSILKENMSAFSAEEQLRYKSRTGRPFMTVDLKVMRADGISEVESDDREVGEIWVRGDTITPGYWKRPDETKKSFEAGWLKTGDLAVIDAEGYVNIVDRKEDVIISGGENIYSTEIETVLYRHPAVLEAAVFGKPDEVWGEAVTAVVALKNGESADDEEIIAFCREQLSVFKAPKSIIFLPEIPKTGSGKISKQLLKAKYSQP